MFGKIAIVACFAFVALQISPTVADTSLIYVNVGLNLNINSGIIATLNAGIDVLVRAFYLLLSVTINATAQIQASNILADIVNLLNILLCRPGVGQCSALIIQASVNLNVQLNLLLNCLELCIGNVLDIVLDLIDALICLIVALLSGTSTTACQNQSNALTVSLNDLLDGLLGNLSVNVAVNINLLNAVIVNLIAIITT